MGRDLGIVEADHGHSRATERPAAASACSAPIAIKSFGDEQPVEVERPPAINRLAAARPLAWVKSPTSIGPTGRSVAAIASR